MEHGASIPEPILASLKYLNALLDECGYALTVDKRYATYDRSHEFWRWAAWERRIYNLWHDATVEIYLDPDGGIHVSCSLPPSQSLLPKASFAMFAVLYPATMAGEFSPEFVEKMEAAVAIWLDAVGHADDEPVSHH